MRYLRCLNAALGSIDRTKLNVKGSSLATGHPFAATGGRVIATLAQLLEQKGAGRGLISICAAGGQGVTARRKQKANHQISFLFFRSVSVSWLIMLNKHRYVHLRRDPMDLHCSGSWHPRPELRRLNRQPIYRTVRT